MQAELPQTSQAASRARPASCRRYELPGEPTRKVAEAAKQRGYQVVLKASPPDLTKAFHVLASGAVDVLFVNEWEALKLSGSKSETAVITAREAKKAAKDLMEKWRSVEMVVVKCLDEEDDTIQTQTLDLLIRMANAKNIMVIAEKLAQDFLNDPNSNAQELIKPTGMEPFIVPRIFKL